MTSSYILALQQYLQGNAPNSPSEDFQPKDHLEHKFTHFDSLQSGNNRLSSHFEADQTDSALTTPANKQEDDLDDEEEYTLEDFGDKHEFHAYLQWKRYLNKVGELQDQLVAKGLLIEKNLDTNAEDFHLSQNPYRLLGLYGSVPARYYNLSPKSKYNEGVLLYYGIIRNADYCQEVDLYHLANQNNIFETLKIVGDQAYDEGLIRTDVFPKFGLDAIPELKGSMPPEDHDKVII